MATYSFGLTHLGTEWLLLPTSFKTCVVTHGETTRMSSRELLYVQLQSINNVILRVINSSLVRWELRKYFIRKYNWTLKDIQGGISHCESRYYDTSGNSIEWDHSLFGEWWCEWNPLSSTSYSLHMCVKKERGPK